MSQNHSEKLKVFAIIQLVFVLIAAGVTLFLGLGTMGFGAVLYAVVLVFSGFLSFFSLCALADAAGYAKTAAYYSEQIAFYINRREQEEQGKTEPQLPPATAFNPDGKIPAWQRVEMEKAEAQRKAAEEAKQ